MHARVSFASSPGVALVMAQRKAGNEDEVIALLAARVLQRVSTHRITANRSIPQLPSSQFCGVPLTTALGIAAYETGDGVGGASGSARHKAAWRWLRLR